MCRMREDRLDARMVYVCVGWEGTDLMQEWDTFVKDGRGQT